MTLEEARAFVERKIADLRRSGWTAHEFGFWAAEVDAVAGELLRFAEEDLELAEMLVGLRDAVEKVRGRGGLGEDVDDGDSLAVMLREAVGAGRGAFWWG